MDSATRRSLSTRYPEYFFFVDEYPTTRTSGKIQKYKLRDQAIEALERQMAAAIETA